MSYRSAHEAIHARIAELRQELDALRAGATTERSLQAMRDARKERLHQAETYVLELEADIARSKAEKLVAADAPAVSQTPSKTAKARARTWRTVEHGALACAMLASPRRRASRAF